jgi:hypothetical protein
MKDRIVFPVPRVNDIVSKAANSGYLSTRIDRSLSRIMPDFVSQGDFPKNYNLKSKKSKKNKTGSLLSRTKYEQTKYKEEQLDIKGLESGKVNDYNFRGKGSLKYNPFANAAGNISQTGGYNAGGDEDFKAKKDKDVIINPRFKLGKRNPKSTLPNQIRQPDPFPAQLKPNAQVKKPHGFIIKSRRVAAHS